MIRAMINKEETEEDLKKNDKKCRQSHNGRKRTRNTCNPTEREKQYKRTSTMRVTVEDNRSYKEVLAGLRMKLGHTKIDGKIRISQGTGGGVQLRVQGSTTEKVQ